MVGRRRPSSPRPGSSGTSNDSQSWWLRNRGPARFEGLLAKLHFDVKRIDGRGIAVNTVAMPKRTNERQQIVAMLRTLLAGTDTVVTESKYFHDEVADMDREVDVVAEMTIDGEVFIASYEVTNQADPVDVQWVEHFLSKHSRLPTDRLYLVPWNGATPKARALVDKTADVAFIDPQVVDGDDGPEVKNLLVDFLFLEPVDVVATLQRPNHELIRALVQHDAAIYSNTGDELESVGEHVNRILRDPDMIAKIVGKAREHPDREELRAFNLSAVYGGEECYLRLTDDENVSEYQLWRSIEIGGHFRFSHRELALELRAFAKEHFAHGRVDLGDVTALAVATVDENDAVDQIHVRFDRVIQSPIIVENEPGDVVTED